ncbi:flavodoxin [Levilactobacillus acidifarinae]|nr:flavodoxin [Levilactobacillus acidifarinae]GEO68199.1 flavodoxin [Levilactobacillus acidifarinae]
MKASQESQKKVTQLAGQPIKAFQLGRSAREWQHGYGTPSDGADTNQQHQPTWQLTPTAKQLIIYFSRSGSTELVASQLAAATQADVLELVVKRPYSGNYLETLRRANTERETEDYPELALRVPDLAQYTTIYLGYPIWAMTLSHPMTEFLTTYGRQLTGKLIAPFMTEGGYGQGDSVERIQAILRGQGARNNRYTRPLVIDGNRADQGTQQVATWANHVEAMA